MKNLVIAIIAVLVVMVFTLSLMIDSSLKYINELEIDISRSQTSIQENDRDIETEKLCRQEVNDLRSIVVTSSSVRFKRKLHNYIEFLEEFVTKKLYEQPDLIPYEGELGGKYQYTDAYLLNNEWVYATFEDGHNSGYALYEFQISLENEVTFILLESHKHGE